MLWMMMCYFFKQKTAYEMRISDWSSDVCSSDLCQPVLAKTFEEANLLNEIARCSSKFLLDRLYRQPSRQHRVVAQIQTLDEHRRGLFRIPIAGCLSHKYRSRGRTGLQPIPQSWRRDRILGGVGNMGLSRCDMC